MPLKGWQCCPDELQLAWFNLNFLRYCQTPYSLSFIFNRQASMGTSREKLSATTGDQHEATAQEDPGALPSYFVTRYPLLNALALDYVAYSVSATENISIWRKHRSIHAARCNTLCTWIWRWHGDGEPRVRSVYHYDHRFHHRHVFARRIPQRGSQTCVRSLMTESEKQELTKIGSISS